jgi:hypothetical protein
LDNTSSRRDPGGEQAKPRDTSTGETPVSAAAPSAVAGAECSLVWPPPEEDLARWEVIALGEAAAASASAAAVLERAPVLSAGSTLPSSGWDPNLEEVGLADGRLPGSAGDAAGPRAAPDSLALEAGTGADAWPLPRPVPIRRDVRAAEAPGAVPVSASQRRGSGRLTYGVVLALTVVLAASAGYLAAVRLRPLPPPAATTATLAVDSDPAGLGVFVEGEPQGATPLTLVLPAGPVRLEIDTPAGRRGLALDLKPGGESSHYFDLSAPAEPAPAGPATTGSIDVRSDPPGAAVTVAGRQRGVTPVTVTDLGPGIHDVLLNYGGRSRIERVAVSAGRTSTVSIGFAAVATPPQTGTLRVRAPVELQVFRSGRPVGSTRAPFSLGAGTHDLELVNERLEFRATATAVVTARQTTTLDIDVPPGRVNFNATPWAEVWLDGRKLGDTPLANVVLPAGEHELVFRHPDFGERRRTAVVPSGGAGRVSIDFRQ